MRVESWNPHIADKELAENAMARLMDAAHVLKDNGARRLRAEIGATGAKPVTRPVYKKGDYANVWWTARNAGELLRSFRVVRKQTKSGKTIFESENVRVIVGNKAAYYADIFETKRPFFRPAFESSLPEMKRIMGAK